MGFFKKENKPIVVDNSIGIQQLPGRYRNVRAHGHQPSIMDCPTCLAHPGQACGGLQRAVYHGPRFTAWKRQMLRDRKVDRKAAQQAAVDQHVASATLRDTVNDIIAARDAQRPEVIKAWARKCAYGEWDFMKQVTDEEVAKYGWTSEHVAFLHRQGDLCVVLGDPAGGKAPGVITTSEFDAFKAHLMEWIEVRKSELEAAKGSVA